MADGEIGEIGEEGQGEVDREVDRALLAEEGGDNRPAVYLDDDGTPIYRASGVYACQNILLAARHGIEGAAAPAWMQQRYDAGHDHEPLILRKLETKYAFRVYGRQEEVTWRIGAAKIRGHVDGLNCTEDFYVTHVDGEPVNDKGFGLIRAVDLGANAVGVIDGKALSQSSFDSWCRGGFKAFPYYAWQQTVYMRGLEAIYLIMAIKNKNTDDMRVELFTVPPAPAGEIVKKVMAVEAMYRQGPQALFRDPCQPATFPCPYFHMHSKEEKMGVDGDVAKALLQLAQAQALAKAREGEAAAEREELDNQIRVLVGGKEVSDKGPEFTTTTYHSTYSATDWDGIAAAVGLTVEQAKTKFTGREQSQKLTVKVTPRSTRSRSTRSKGSINAAASA